MKYRHLQRQLAALTGGAHAEDIRAIQHGRPCPWASPRSRELAEFALRFIAAAHEQNTAEGETY
jgi:hypothetical protein